MGRANSKKRSWRRVDASEAEKTAQMKSAADSCLFMIDSAVQRSTNKSAPSKNTLNAAKKFLKSHAAEKQKDRLPQMYDLWADAGSKLLKTRPPVLANSDPLLAGIVKRKLEPAHPGTSYNPSKEDQQKAIEIAYGIHLKENEAEMIWSQKMEQARNAAVGNEEVDEEADEASETIVIVKAPIRAENRLTKATRNKRRRHNMQMAEAAARKQKKSILRQIDTIQELAVVKKPVLKKSKSSRSIQLGKYKVKSEFPAVLLSDEVTNNLRDVAFQPTILRDTFLSFQRKGLIEPRHRVKSKPVRVKLYNRYKDQD